MLRVGSSVRILPSVGFTLAPYGTEWTVRTFIGYEPGDGRARPRMRSIAFRVGDTGAGRTWAAAARVSDIIIVRGISIATSLDLWRQPPVLADKTSDPRKMGARATATLVVPLPPPLRSEWVRGIHVTTGYKSEGYVPGEQLSGGLVFRAGLQMR
jgi:hypothetical protein